jgi:hypothetical protein
MRPERRIFFASDITYLTVPGAEELWGTGVIIIMSGEASGLEGDGINSGLD